MVDETYEGIPLEELRIESIDWTYRGDYIRSRSARKGQKEFDVEPAWATEAALDPERIVRTTDRKSIKVIGRSASAPARSEDALGRILKVWIVPKDLAEGEWWGTTACDANDRDRSIYKEVT